MSRLLRPGALALLTAAALAGQAGATPPVLSADCLKDIEGCKARVSAAELKREAAAGSEVAPAPAPSPPRRSDSVALPGAPAPSAEAPLPLSNRHLGLSREQLEERGLALQAPPELPPTPETAPEQASRAAEPHQEVLPEPGPDRAQGGGFEACVETSIRAGNALAESQRVCQALHPEPPSPSPAPGE